MDSLNQPLKPLLFLGLFATFGGAYWGAKVSGEKASKIAKNQMIMDDLKMYSTNNREFIKRIDECKIKVLINEVHHKGKLSDVLEFQVYKVNVKIYSFKSFSFLKINFL